MATVRRHGSLSVLWNGATVNAADATANSNYAATGREMDQLLLYIKTTAGTGAAPAFKLQVAGSTGDTSEGIGVDIDEATLAPGYGGTSPWYDYFYQNNLAASQGAPGAFATGAGSFAIGLPDFVAGYIRLVCTAGTGLTVTAGYEAWGD